MLLVLVFVVAAVAAFLGALPPGTVNLSVVNAGFKEHNALARQIIISAGIAEMVLAFLAIHCSILLKGFFAMNIWIQYILLTIILAAALYLILGKQKPEKSENKKSRGWLTGLLLGFLNPPVLIFWILAVSFINGRFFTIAMPLVWQQIVVFLLGVYAGKVLALFLYLRFSHLIKKKVHNILLIANKLIGFLLLIIVAIQGGKLLF